MTAATADEISTPMMAIRGAAPATWRLIEHIPGIGDLAKDWKIVHEPEHGK